MRCHSQFVAEFYQFLFHVSYECSVAHLVRASSQSSEVHGFESWIRQLIFSSTMNVRPSRQTCNTRFFGALVACQKKTQFAPFRRHSQFVAEFGQFLFHVSYECSVAHLVRASCQSAEDHGFESWTVTVAELVRATCQYTPVHGFESQTRQ